MSIQTELIRADQLLRDDGKGTIAQLAEEVQKYVDLYGKKELADKELQSAQTAAWALKNQIMERVKALAFLCRETDLEVLSVVTVYLVDLTQQVIDVLAPIKGVRSGELKEKIYRSMGDRK